MMLSVTQRYITEQPKMTTMNSSIEVDLTGQMVSDSIGNRIYSGCGGQLEFHAAASTQRARACVTDLLRPAASVVVGWACKVT